MSVSLTRTGQSRIRKAIVRSIFQNGVACPTLMLNYEAGMAILSKHKPLAITRTLPGHPDPSIVKGRIITLEYEGCYIIGTYVVNAGMGLKVTHYPRSFSAPTDMAFQTLEAKKEWNAHFETYIRDLDKKKPVIWAGDMNVAPTELGTTRILIHQANVPHF